MTTSPATVSVAGQGQGRVIESDGRQRLSRNPSSSPPLKWFMVTLGRLGVAAGEVNVARLFVKLLTDEGWCKICKLENVCRVEDWQFSCAPSQAFPIVLKFQAH